METNVNPSNVMYSLIQEFHKVFSLLPWLLGWLQLLASMENDTTYGLKLMLFCLLRFLSLLLQLSDFRDSVILQSSG